MQFKRFLAKININKATDSAVIAKPVALFIIRERF